jgi:integrase
MALAFALALFTSVRGNVLAAKWDDIDIASRTWRIPHTKRHVDYAAA